MLLQRPGSLPRTEGGLGDEGAARWTRRPARGPKAVLLACAAGALMVLALPYAVPMRPALSFSYCVGFNNKACLLALLVFLVGFAAWYGPLLRLPVSGAVDGRERLGWRTLVTGVALSVPVAGAEWWFCHRYGPIFEASYVLDRVRHLAAGERVYRDFEFAYGAALLYVPVWLARLPGLQLLDAVMLTVLLEGAAGVVLQWWVMRRLFAGVRRGKAVFFLLLAPCLLSLLLLGEQYTGLRFWVGTATAVALYEMAQAERRARWLWVALPLATAGLLLLFPEQAVALLCAVCAFAVMQGLPGGRGALVAGVMLSGAVLAGAAGTGVFTMFLVNAGGGYALPVTVSPVYVPVIGLLLVGVCAVVEEVRVGRGARVESLLLMLALCQLPAAFVHFDAVHLMNCMPGLVVGWSLVAREERAWRWAAAGWAVLLLVPMLPYVGLAGVGQTRRATAVTQGRAYVVGDAAGRPRIYAPFAGMEVLQGVGPAPFVPVTGRFYGTENLMTADEVETAVAEVERQGAVVVHAGYGCTWSPHRTEVMAATMGLWVRRPFRAVHLLAPLCAALARDFDAGEEVGPGVRVLRHR